MPNGHDNEWDAARSSRRQPLDARAHCGDGDSAARELSVDDIDQIIEGIDHFVIGTEPDIEVIWQPYLDKLAALRKDLRLVAAAPELLAALKAMEDTAMRLGLSRGDSDDERWGAALLAHFAAIEQARAAIAKAEG